MLPIAPSTETRPCLETVCKNDAPRMIHLDATGGEAAEILYSVFPGMELIYRDIHARSCREARGDSGERLEIHHCLEGRVEYRQNGRYFYLAPGIWWWRGLPRCLRAAAFPPGITMGSRW